jgi:hypothetical protein
MWVNDDPFRAAVVQGTIAATAVAVIAGGMDPGFLAPGVPAFLLAGNDVQTPVQSSNVGAFPIRGRMLAVLTNENGAATLNGATAIEEGSN